MKPIDRLRTRPRSASESLERTRPSTSTSPRVSVSSPPMMCSSVLLPDPEAPTIASVSPRLRLKLTSVSTSVLRSPSSYVLAIPLARNTMFLSMVEDLFIAQRLRRLRARSAPRGIERRQQREHEGDQRNPADVAGDQLAGHFADVIDVRRKEDDAGDVLDPLDDRRQ